MTPPSPPRPTSAPGPTPAPRLPRVRASELVGRGWLNTGGRELTLAGLRGKVVLLDFWTFCCVNCLHVLDELRDLEAAHRDELVIVGVHSPKFEHEADPAALANAVERYGVAHPVLDDGDLVTWSAFAARAWPTLVVVDPEGYIVAQLAGEGHAVALAALVDELIAEHDAKGTLHRGDGPYVPPVPRPSTLRFPAKAIVLPTGNLLVADAGHHSLAELAPDGETLVRRIGSGERGLLDGSADEARFNEPNGLCLVPEHLRQLGDVLVADTVNHAIRAVRLDGGTVTTVAGTGEQFMVGGGANVTGSGGVPARGGGVRPDGAPEPFDPACSYGASRVRLSSPWDIAWSPELGAFAIAMAGNHSLWVLSVDGASIRLLAGTMNEGREDGAAAEAWFAQPSGLATGPDGRLWVADAETSALRWVAGVGDDLAVHTAVGQGLFDFGHVDGPADGALMQHPLGVAELPDGSVVVADTYNGAIRRYVTGSPGTLATLATGLAEPSGVIVLVNGEPWGQARAGGAAAGSAEPAARPAPAPGDRLELLVVESAAHRLTRLPLPATLAGETVDAGARRTRRPATAVLAGPLRLEVPFVLPTGQKLDDTFGPSTSLQVSATPPELLLDGSGTGTDLVRDLSINPDVSDGVLHVTAKAASCDIVPEGMEDEVFPACHLAQQDWGVPIRVVAEPDAAFDRTLTLPLRG